MNTITFRGKKFNNLIEEIEKEYEKNYKIVNQKEVNKVPLLFWMKQYEIEVEVISDVKSTQQQIKQLNKNHLLNEVSQNKNMKFHTDENFETKKQQLLDLLDKNDMEDSKATIKGDESEQMKIMQNMMQEMMKKIDSKKEEQGVYRESEFLESNSEKVLRNHFENLIEAEVQEDIARLIVSEVQENLNEDTWLDQEVVQDEVLAVMTKKLQVTGELNLDEVKVMALIGPTGVGKTTTIAKIAGYMTDKKRKVGLITTDVFRIGATDQLQIYANILDSEMIAVNSPDELEAAIAKLKYEYKVDQILIDTVGRSPMDEGSIHDVQEYLEIAEPDHVGLVLSSTQKTKDVKKILENFKGLNIESLLFTKLDETLNHGVMLNAVINGNVKISYVTNGQNVPYDIYQASPTALAKKILIGVDEFGSSIFTA